MQTTPEEKLSQEEIEKMVDTFLGDTFTKEEGQPKKEKDKTDEEKNIDKIVNNFNI